jgi:hypothetical protein
VPRANAGLKDFAWPPDFASAPVPCASTKPAPHSPPLAVADAIPDPVISSRPAASSFSKVKEMTMLLEQHIEELRAEMNHCHPDERRQIAAELELALAELAVIMAEQDGSVDAVPPF